MTGRAFQALAPGYTRSPNSTARRGGSTSDPCPILCLLHCHCIFSTKRPCPFLNADLRDRSLRYAGGILRERGCVLVAAGGMPDHVHLLVSMSRDVSVAEALRVVKANTSKWIHETFPDLGRSPGRPVMGRSRELLQCGHGEGYIARQAEHHRSGRFRMNLSCFAAAPDRIRRALFVGVTAVLPPLRATGGGAVTRAHAPGY